MFVRYYRKVLKKRKKISTKIDKQYYQHRTEAKELIEERLNYWSRLSGLKFNRVIVRNQKTRWGSCSARGNLSFNYKMMFLPVCLVDYIIVHELCHLKELNHSKRFWLLVEKQLPDYQKSLKELKSIEKLSKLNPEMILKFQNEHECNKCPAKNENNFTATVVN